MILNQSYDYQKDGAYDLAMFDPPFDIWEDIKWKPEARTYVCFTNFQNRHHVTRLMGERPKFEMIWHFKDGRWVSHKMPRHTHEHILIYGELKNEAYTGPKVTDRTPVKRSRGGIGTDKSLGPSWYIPRERKLLNSVIEVPRSSKNRLGLWGKPEALALPIMHWLSNEGDKILDGFAGSGTFGVCATRIGAEYFGTEIRKETCDKANQRLQQEAAQLF